MLGAAASSAKNHLKALTGLRIVAATAVFLSHVTVIDSVPTAAKTFMASGYNGVTLFFVLSGFVLAWNYADRLRNPRPRELWSFFVARFARVYPLYLFALLIVATPFFAAGAVDGGFWIHIAGAQAWDPDVTRAFSYNRPGWSVGVEFFLYACFPVVIAILSRFSKRGLLWAMFVVIVLVVAVTAWFEVTGRGGLSPLDPESAHRWLYRTPLTRLGDFTVGVIAALLIMQRALKATWAARLAQGAGTIGFVALMLSAPLLYSTWTWDAAYLLPSLLLIWGLANAPSTYFARLLSTKPMILMGEASFAFYLLHTFVQDRMPASAANFRSWILLVFAQFVVAILLAIGTHLIVEKQCQRWLRRKLDPPRAAVSTPEDELALLEEAVSDSAHETDAGTPRSRSRDTTSAGLHSQ